MYARPPMLSSEIPARRLRRRGGHPVGRRAAPTRVAERVRRSFEEHRFLTNEGLAITLTTSVGVAGYPDHGNEKTTLLDLADQALYEGKRGSRNVVFVADADRQSSGRATSRR